MLSLYCRAVPKTKLYRTAFHVVWNLQTGITHRPCLHVTALMLLAGCILILESHGMRPRYWKVMENKPMFATQ